MTGKEVVARFEAERQALALMDHPNVARVYDAGATENGRPYFVMELVNGVPITEFCDKNKQPTRERLALFMDVCYAVQHAHQKGIIHRDLKPNNIMVTLHDGKPVPKVIDFGVAKALSQQLTEKTIYTSYGQVIGTPQYMSPEQAEMSGLGIDTRSDIYSLGVLLYELLTGKPPVSSERLLASGYAEMMRIICDEEPPRPSRRISTLGQGATAIAKHRGTDEKRLGRSLQGELDWIVMKSLEKDRERRYDTAANFATDIKRFLNNEAVQACPPSTAYRVRKFVLRYRAAVLMGLSLTILLFAGIVGTSTGWLAERQSRREVEERQREVVRQRNKAQAAQKHESLQRDIAERESKAAAAAERKSRQMAETRRQELYVAQVNLAHQAWRDGDLERAQNLLASQRPAPNQTDLRGFEWRYLWQLCQDESRQLLRTLTEGTVTWNQSSLMSFSAEGGKLAIADGRMVRVWDFAGRRELATLDIQADRVRALAFSPTSPDLLAIGDSDHIKLWDLTTNSPPTILAEDTWVEALAFSPDGEKLALALGWGGGRVELWDVETNTRTWESKQRHGHGEGPDPAFCVAFSPDGKLVASGGGDTNVRLLEAQTRGNRGIHSWPCPPR